MSEDTKDIKDVVKELEELRQKFFVKILAGQYDEEFKSIRNKIREIEDGKRKEEIKKEDARLHEKHHTKEILALVAKAKEEYKESGVTKGAYDCPICKDGKFVWAIATNNGHIHAGCTKGCISIME